MAELELNYGTMQECISNLQSLASDYPAEIRPLVSGEGQGISEIEALADLYVSFYEALEALSEGTVKYLTGMVTDFKEADEKKNKDVKYKEGRK